MGAALPATAWAMKPDARAAAAASRCSSPVRVRLACSSKSRESVSVRMRSKPMTWIAWMTVVTRMPFGL